ncbi:MAG: hypothetical protein ACYSSP_14355 [Planctomycetota bacterium]
MSMVRYVKEEPREFCFIQQATIRDNTLERCVSGRKKLIPRAREGTEHTLSDVLVSVVCLSPTARI